MTNGEHSPKEWSEKACWRKYENYINKAARWPLFPALGFCLVRDSDRRQISLAGCKNGISANAWSPIPTCKAGRASS